MNLELTGFLGDYTNSTLKECLKYFLLRMRDSANENDTRNAGILPASA